MKIVLSGWRGGIFEFRVSMKNRELFRGLTKVKLQLPDSRGEFCQTEIELTPSFWRKCPEIRDKKIGEWMRERGDIPWTKGSPPKYEAEMTSNHLRVKG